MRKRPAAIPHRSAAVLIAVLVCLLIAGVITTTAVQSSLRQRRETSRHHQMEQTRWLLEAGIVQLQNQIASDANYAGETWNVSAAMDDQTLALIEIAEIDQVDDSSAWRITATIHDSRDRLRVTRRSQIIRLP